jgi:hypothetical protein
MRSLIFLLFSLLIIFVIAHPPVSNPRQVLDFDSAERDIEDLYAQAPFQRPLHTTKLMAQPTGAARGTNVRETNLNGQFGEVSDS